MATDTYPSFDENPECRCYPNGTAATVCMTGHMTECHYPKTCDQAQCSHYRFAIAAERNPEDYD